jgi:hypothetical protein
MCFANKKKNTVILGSCCVISMGAVSAGVLAGSMGAIVIGGGVTCITSVITLSEVRGCTHCTEQLECQRDCAQRCSRYCPCFANKKGNTVIVGSSCMISIGAMVVGVQNMSGGPNGCIFPWYCGAGWWCCLLTSGTMFSEWLGCTNCTEPLDWSRLCYNRDTVVAVTATEDVDSITPAEAEWPSNVDVAKAEWHSNVNTTCESE